MWTDASEALLQLWVRQIVGVATLYARGATRSRFLKFVFIFAGLFCSAYTAIVPIPAVGCDIVSGDACARLQWSSIAMAIVGIVTGGIGLAYDFSRRVVLFEEASKKLLKLARRIDMQLQRERAQRHEMQPFKEWVLSKFEKYTEPKLSSCVRTPAELANMSLLQNYDAAHAAPVTPVDREIMSSLQYQLSRLNANVTGSGDARNNV